MRGLLFIFLLARKLGFIFQKTSLIPVWDIPLPARTATAECLTTIAAEMSFRASENRACSSTVLAGLFSDSRFRNRLRDWKCVNFRRLRMVVMGHLFNHFWIIVQLNRSMLGSGCIRFRRSLGAAWLVCGKREFLRTFSAITSVAMLAKACFFALSTLLGAVSQAFLLIFFLDLTQRVKIADLFLHLNH